MHPYINTDHALRAAFASCESSVLRRGSSGLPDYWQSSLTHSSGTFDRVAQQAMTLGVLTGNGEFGEQRGQGMSEFNLTVLKAQYLESPTIEKDNACLEVARKLADATDTSVPFDYLADAVRGFFHAPRLYSEVEWARRLNKAPDTLRRWRNGNPQRRTVGIYTILDDWLASAKGEAFPLLVDAEIVPLAA